MMNALLIAAAISGATYLMPSEDPELNPDKDDHAPRYGAPTGYKGQRGYPSGSVRPTNSQTRWDRRYPVYCPRLRGWR